MLPFIFAASLNITSPFVVAPNRREVVSIRGSAALSNSAPGTYKITAHYPLSKEQQKVVGEAIKSVRISPPKMRLKGDKSRRFVANVTVDSDYSGLVYLCIISDEPPANNKGLVFVARSCYASRVSSK